MKPLLLSTLIAFVVPFAIAPICGASETAVNKPAAAKTQKATKKHRPARKTQAAKKQAVEPPAQIAPQVAPAQSATQSESPALMPASETPPANPQPSANPYVQVNPYLQATRPAFPGVVAVVPMAPATVMVPVPGGNPYLQPVIVRPVAIYQPTPALPPAYAALPPGGGYPVMPAYPPYGMASPLTVAPADVGFTTRLKGLVPTQLSSLLSGGTGESRWPISYKTVYPTGEKPLFVLTLKCPTEAAFGISPPPVKLVHVLVDGAMDGINYTNLLPVNLQQVCQ